MKYELTSNTKKIGNTTLYQIKALISFNGKAWVSGNAGVYKATHILICGPIGSRHGTTTFYRTKNNTVWVTCGCFSGSIDDFATRVDKVHKGTKHQVTYQAAIALARAQIELEQQEGER